LIVEGTKWRQSSEPAEINAFCVHDDQVDLNVPTVKG
jgi:hypothetical protein